jgi:glycosyltransferase involved in cell wall biosynthesis
MRVLYLYAGSRRAFYEKWKRGEVPDTQLLGLNYMKDLGVDAEFIEWRFCEFLRRINFNLVHLPYIFAIKKYDIVFMCAGLPLVFLAKYILRWKKPRFVIYNTYLANALARNPQGLSGFITRTAIQNLNAIVCTARAQIPPLLAAGIAQEKIHFAPIGIDVHKFIKNQRIVPKENIAQPDGASIAKNQQIFMRVFGGELFSGYILSVGRDLGRDYKTLFEAVRGLDVKMIVATKPEAVAGLAIPPNVEIRFHVPYEEMPALYRSALFVMTPLKTSHPDGSETSGQYGFLEPMAAGKAVIVSDKPSVRDYIEHDRTGILVEPENPAALRVAIEKLLADEPLRTRLGETAKESVSKNFTSSHWARSLAKVFRSSC